MTQERPGIYVRLDGVSRWEILVEEVVVAVADTKGDALLMQSVCQYVFGQHMVSSTKALNMFLEKTVLRLNTGAYIPVRTRDVMKELKM